MERLTTTTCLVWLTRASRTTIYLKFLTAMLDLKLPNLFSKVLLKILYHLLVL